MHTVSTSAVLVLASVPPIDLLAEERKETFQLRKELTCLTGGGAQRESFGQAVGAQLTPDTMVSLMLQSEQIWMLIESFVILVMKTMELDGPAEPGNNGGQ